MNFNRVKNKTLIIKNRIMKAKEFLRCRNIVAKDKSDLIIGFDNGTKESLVELLESYHNTKLNELNLLDMCNCNIQEFMQYYMDSKHIFNEKVIDVLQHINQTNK